MVLVVALTLAPLWFTRARRLAAVETVRHDARMRSLRAPAAPVPAVRRPDAVLEPEAVG
jgi:hypothetical protein